MTTDDSIAYRAAHIQERIAAACARVGRSSSSVTLLPVSKTFSADAIREAVTLGYNRFGENKTQEIRQKSTALQDLNIQWVVIGHLQTNKAKDVARDASEVQSLDRLELAHALHRRLDNEGREIDVLIQIKTSTEPSKHGLPPEEASTFLRTIVSECPTLKVKGLMTMAENTDDPSAVRACFRLLRTLRDTLQAEGISGVQLDRLSMGMSGDFEIAIEEGATEVRIGSAFFGARNYA
jgi:pyridoxal phosphate enzyme (YggS family)